MTSRNLDHGSLPGITELQWSASASPARGQLPLEVWSCASLPEKISLEVAAVQANLLTKSDQYRSELDRVTSASRRMPDSQRIGIVMPAYNEHEGILKTLGALVNQRALDGSPMDPALWGATIVVNRPIVGETTRDAVDAKNLIRTVEIIEEFKATHPQLDIEYLIAEVPREKANVGLARMLGHDFAALRSSRREEGKRTAPFYIQTMDADTPGLHPNYIAINLAQLEKDQYGKDLYRQCGRFPISELRKSPLLHSMDFLWTDTIRAIAENSDSAWTAGAGILVSLFAHASSGGVFPFRHQRGVDEDLRIGIHARLLRGHGETRGQGQIETPLFEIDPRRVILVIGDLLETLKERNFQADSPINREIHDIATLLKSYLDFNSTEIRGRNSPQVTDMSWLEDPVEFQRAVSPKIIEVIANSYRELIRVELSLDRAKMMFPNAAEVYRRFTSGEMAYSVMRGEFNKIELEIAGLADSNPRKIAMSEVWTEASGKASLLMAEILRKHGIECETVNVDYIPPGNEPQSILQTGVRVRSLDGYREQLLSLLR